MRSRQFPEAALRREDVLREDVNLPQLRVQRRLVLKEQLRVGVDRLPSTATSTVGVESVAVDGRTLAEADADVALEVDGLI